MPALIQPAIVGRMGLWMRAPVEGLLVCSGWHWTAPESAAVNAVGNADLEVVALLAESPHREGSTLRDYEVATAVQVLSLMVGAQSRPWARPRAGK